jgi:uncharacterized protein Yka (UPF0111/DUF47 family)
MGRDGMEHRDIALQLMQDNINEASETMAQARAALATQEINQLHHAKQQVDQSEEALQHTYEVIQHLFSEGKASFVDYQNLQQVLHQLANVKFKLNHLEQRRVR